MLSRIALAATLCSCLIMAPAAQAQDAADPPLRLTIYTNGLALVDVARTLPTAPAGTVRLDGVGPKLIADSVRVDMENDAELREITLDSNILTRDSLLRRHLGKTVRVIRTNPATGQEIVEEAEILSVQGGLVLKINERIETGVPGRIVFSDVPEDLHATPRLTLTFDKAIEAPVDARIGYLTGGLSWDAVYTVVLNDAHTQLDLDGWAKIVNDSGVDLGPASVALVAGEVSRESAPPQGKILMRAESMMASTPRRDAARQTLSAFHLYDLPGRAMLRDNGTTQRRLLGATAVASKRELLYRGGASVFGPMRGPTEPEPVQQRVIIENDVAAHLGMPLPAGMVRAYTRDSDGALRFIGEDRIANIAIGDEIALDLGRAFDVAVSRRQTNFRRLGDRTTEAAFSLNIRNGGATPVTVDVREDIPGDWEIVDENLTHTADGAAAQWSVPVPAGDVFDLTYRVRVRR